MRTVKRKTTVPGEILSEEFLKPLGMTQKGLANHLGCDVKVINRIVNERTSVTAETALKLAATFGTPPEVLVECTAGPGSLPCFQKGTEQTDAIAEGQIAALLP